MNVSLRWPTGGFPRGLMVLSTWALYIHFASSNARILRILPVALEAAHVIACWDGPVFCSGRTSLGPEKRSRPRRLAVVSISGDVNIFLKISGYLDIYIKVIQGGKIINIRLSDL